MKVKASDQFGKVAVAIGGTSTEREISLMGGRAVTKALLRLGVHAVPVEMGVRPWDRLAGGGFDRVFNLIHGRGGEDGVLQGLLEAVGIPYTGSGVLGSALSMDKVATKLCWQGAGLPTPAWQILRTEADLSRSQAVLGFPMIIKPALEGSSIGITKANDWDELVSAWDVARQYGCLVLAERWVEGVEYTVAILQDDRLPVIRLETPRSFYDYEAKYLDSQTRYHCPCGLSSAEERRLQDLAWQACELLRVSGWARVDMFRDQTGLPWLIEVNTVPGMTDHSLLPMAAQAAGITFDELVWRILETSVGA